MIELIPGARHIAALADANAETSKHFQALQDSARAHGIGLELRMAATSEEITPAIDEAKASAVAGVYVLSSPLVFANRRSIF